MITKPTIYTPSVVLEQLQGMLQQVNEDREIVYYGALFEDKPYSRAYFNELLVKYKSNRKITTTINAIKELLESRVITGAITGKYNPASTIFHLKNNYNWTDRQDIQLNPPTQNMEPLSNEQKLKIIDRARKTLSAKVVNTLSSVKLLTEPQITDSK